MSFWEFGESMSFHRYEKVTLKNPITLLIIPCTYPATLLSNININI